MNSGVVGRTVRSMLRRWIKTPPTAPAPQVLLGPPRLGLALGGGFARGVTHIGILRVLERENIPIHCITGVSAGAIVAAAFASGTEVNEIARIGCSMRFADVARWTLCRLGLLQSERMAAFLKRLLRKFTFEEMQTPLGILATDLGTGDAVSFRDAGDVIVPIRASCSYPGLFQPIRYQDRLLVDGAMCTEVPAQLARKMGATHVISVCLPMQGPDVVPSNMLQVVNRCFQILQSRAEATWRRHSDVVIVPDVTTIAWDGFKSGCEMIEAGEKAAEGVLPQIRKWLDPEYIAAATHPIPEELAS